MVIQFLIYKKSDKKTNPILKDESQYKSIRLFNKSYEVNIIRSSYAIKMGLVIAISALIIDILKLEQGKWIVYTVFSLSELYSEHCISRSKDRLKGTLLGAAIIVVLFTLIKDNSLRAVIALVAGYLDSYTSHYRNKMICVTVSVITTVSLTNGIAITAVSRIAYVIIGILATLLVEKIFLSKNVTIN